MKTVLTIIATAVLSMRVIAAADPVRKADAIQWQAEMRWGGEFGRSPIEVFTRIPASLRTVPWHPDDDYGTGHSTTISDASLNPPGFAMMNWTFTSGVTIKERVTFRTGPGSVFKGLAVATSRRGVTGDSFSKHLFGKV